MPFRFSLCTSCNMCEDNSVDKDRVREVVTEPNERKNPASSDQVSSLKDDDLISHILTTHEKTHSWRMRSMSQLFKLADMEKLFTMYIIPSVETAIQEDIISKTTIKYDRNYHMISTSNLLVSDQKDIAKNGYEWLSRVYQPDADKSILKWLCFKESKDIFLDKYRVVSDDNKLRYCVTWVTPVKERGLISEFQGVVYEITESKYNELSI